MRLWFEGIIKRREAFEGLQWNLSMFEHQGEDVGKEREIEDAGDNHLEEDRSRWFLRQWRGQP